MSGRQQSILNFFSPNAKKMTAGSEDRRDMRAADVGEHISQETSKARPEEIHPIKNTTDRKKRLTQSLVPLHDDDDDDDVVASVRPKRRRVVIDTSEDDDDEKPNEDRKNALQSSSMVTSFASANVSKSPMTPKTKGKKTNRTRMDKENSLTTGLDSSFDKTVYHNKSMIDNDDIMNISVASAFDDAGESTEFTHQKLAFLKPENIRDAEGNKPCSNQYDSTTLFVPPSFYNDLSPAMYQWWMLKSEYFDTLLCFKIGKFYELYHMDAEIAAKELNLAMMKGGDHAHCGFPEIAGANMMDTLASRHYKVARVEQTETPKMMSERLKGTPGRAMKSDKTIRREICEIVTNGTRRPLLTARNDTQVGSLGYLYALKVSASICNSHSVEIAFAAADVCTGTVVYGQFQDNAATYQLLITVLSRHQSSQIILAPGCPQTLVDRLSEFETTFVEQLSKNRYEQSKNYVFIEPVLLKISDQLRDLSSETAFDALKMLGKYLNICCIDHEVFSRDHINLLQPSLNQISWNSGSGKPMVIDAAGLNSLHITGGEKSRSKKSDNTCLLNTVDFCLTTGGRKLLKSWITVPMTCVDTINSRLDAVEALSDPLSHDFLSQIRRNLDGFPTLETMLMSIHAMSSHGRQPNHPNNRAIMFNQASYGKHKLDMFVRVMQSLEKAAKLLVTLRSLADCPARHSKLIKAIISVDEDQEAIARITDFKKSFDVEAAKRDGAIVPNKGILPEYDSAVELVETIETTLENYKEKLSLTLKCTLKYVGTAKNRYQIEVPVEKCKNVPEDFELTSTKKNFNRYWNPWITDKLEKLIEAEDLKASLLRESMERLFAKFDDEHILWSAINSTVSQIDLIQSMVKWKDNLSAFVYCCRPAISHATLGERFVRIKNSLHPTMCLSSDSSYIPNDINISSEDRNVIVLTGPNMGGKSTLIRQLGVLVVLAHAGFHVPARQCSMTTVDRIFTRIGAGDRLEQGQSTFHIELSETQPILTEATENSLALIDEFGRGTATYDGCALAHAVLKHLATKRACRTIFSTHYHTLVSDPSLEPVVKVMHMGFMNDVDSEGFKRVIFLYKLTDGQCDKSHGFNVALLAGLPIHTVKLAEEKAQMLERKTILLNTFRMICAARSQEDLKQLLEETASLVSL